MKSYTFCCHSNCHHIFDSADGVLCDLKYSRLQITKDFFQWHCKLGWLFMQPLKVLFKNYIP